MKVPEPFNSQKIFSLCAERKITHEMGAEYLEASKERSVPFHEFLVSFVGSISLGVIFSGSHAALVPVLAIVFFPIAIWSFYSPRKRRFVEVHRAVQETVDG